MHNRLTTVCGAGRGAGDRSACTLRWQPCLGARRAVRTRVRDGLLGDCGFDANGDITNSPVTVLRVARRGSSTTTMSVEGGVVERVVRPPADLVARQGWE